MCYRKCLPQLWRPWVSQAALYKVENYETWWWNSDWLQRSENQGGAGIDSKFKGSRSKSSDVWGQKNKDVPVQKEKDLPYFHLCVVFRPSLHWMMPTHICQGRSLLTLLNQMLVSSRKTLKNTLRSNVPPPIWASHSLVK